MSLHEDRIEKTLGSVTGDYDGQIPEPQSRIEVLLQKILENGGGSGSGIQSAILDESQYDIHGIPIVENPVEGLLYLVPNGESGDDTYNEFLYVDGAWEKIGTTYENGYTKSELDFKLPFGVESITVGNTILDNVTLSMHKDGDEDWYISDNISGLTTTNFKVDNYYILEIDGVSKLCRGEYLPSGYPDFGADWHDCTVVGDLGLIGKRCATPEEIAALPEGTIVSGGYYATFDNRFPEFKFDDYCIAGRFKNDTNFNMYTSDTSATHTVTLKSATVVFTQVPSYLSGMNGVARYTNDGGNANTSLGNAGLQPSDEDTVYAEGIRNYVTGLAAHAEGECNVVSGECSHAEGIENIASGFDSHAEGECNVVSGDNSHAEGSENVASGLITHAEGSENVASGECSHVEGVMNVVSGGYSHAEGYSNVAGGSQNHVEGRNNVTSNMATHASGVLNVASGNASFVIGQACVEDTESTDRTMDLNSSWAANYKKNVFIVGNGVGDHANGHEQASTRSNAHTLDWHGNAEYAGDVKANACGGQNPVSLVGLDSVVDGMTTATASDEGKALKAKTVSGGKVVEWEFGETVTPDPEVVEGAVSNWLDEHPEATTTVEDGSISYAKFDSQLKARHDAVKAALLACFRKVAWIDGNGQDYYDALETALNGGTPVPPAPEYTWRYTPNDGLLSAQSYCTREGSPDNYTAGVEKIENDELVLIDAKPTSISGNGVNTAYRFGVAEKCSLKCQFKCVSPFLYGTTTNPSNMGLRFQLSNGVSGARVYIGALVNTDTLMALWYEGNQVRHVVESNFLISDYHEIEMSIDGSLQNIKIDGVVIASDAELNASMYMTTGVIMQHASSQTVETHIKYIEFDDEPAELYKLDSSRQFTGQADDYIDTGVKLLDGDKDFTIVLDADEVNHNYASNSSYSIYGFKGTNNTGFLFRANYASGSGSLNYTLAYGVYSNPSNKYQSTVQFANYAGDTSASNNHIRAAISHAAGSDACIVSVRVNDTYANMGGYDGTYAYVPYNGGNLIVGARQKSDTSEPVELFDGVVNEFTIYSYAMNANEITAFMSK